MSTAARDFRFGVADSNVFPALIPRLNENLSKLEIDMEGMLMARYNFARQNKINGIEMEQ